MFTIVNKLIYKDTYYYITYKIESIKIKKKLKVNNFNNILNYKKNNKIDIVNN